MIIFGELNLGNRKPFMAIRDFFADLMRHQITVAPGGGSMTITPAADDAIAMLDANATLNGSSLFYERQDGEIPARLSGTISSFTLTSRTNPGETLNVTLPRPVSITEIRSTVLNAPSPEAGVEALKTLFLSNPADPTRPFFLDYSGSSRDECADGHNGLDFLFGGDGNDTLLGLGGDDNLAGGIGNDVLLGGPGRDQLTGNDGLDLFGGTPGDLHNDTIHDVTTGEGILVEGSFADPITVQRLLGQAFTLQIDTDGDGVFETSLTVSGFNNLPDPEIREVPGGSLIFFGEDGILDTGNPGDDTIRGGAGDDTLRGLGGDDIILGFSGSDTLSGGEGNDLLEGGPNTLLDGPNLLEGDAGLDTLVGGFFDDTLDGGLDADLLRGRNGNDLLNGGGGDDTLVGGVGLDTLIGGEGTDRGIFDMDLILPPPSPLFPPSVATATPGAPGDLVFDTPDGRVTVSNDVEFLQFNNATLTFAEAMALFSPIPTINGDENSNTLNGTSDAERINGLGSADWINPGGGSDTIDGGEGRDMVSFVNLPDTPGRTFQDYRLDIDLGAGTAVNHTGSEQIQLINVERITGTIHADRIRGSDGDDQLRGSGDYDWFIATQGADTLDGGNGKDMVSYLEWLNTDANQDYDFFNDSGVPPMSGDVTGVVVDLNDTGNNTHLAAGHTYVSIERITGSGRQDVFYGDGESNDFRGLGDYDWFVGSAGGRERYFGGDGVDTVTYFRSTSGVTANLRNGATVNGQETGYGTQGDAARDLYFEIENLIGTNFDDSLTGNGGRNQLSGLDGDDMLFGYGGIDQLKGGAGNDTLNGGGSSDYAIFSGDRAEYTITKTGARSATVSSAAEGTDTLLEMEYLRFADGDVAIWDL